MCNSNSSRGQAPVVGEMPRATRLRVHRRIVRQKQKPRDAVEQVAVESGTGSVGDISTLV